MTRSLFCLTTLLWTLAGGAAAADPGSPTPGTLRLAQQTERGSPPAARTEEIDVQLREAEERLAEAAARVAELSRQRLPETYGFERRIRIDDGPMLGVTIGSEDGRGPTEGVTIRGLTPGGAAADAGLQSGDVLTSVNGEALSADSEEAANRKLLDFMAGVEEGDTLDVEYLRGGKSASVQVKPRPMPGHVFAFGPGNAGFMTRPLPAPAAPGAAVAPNVFSFFVGGGTWNDMEMVSLTDDLGRYFGTDEGLLVVRAPSDATLELRDGDVIQRIDGREPTSVSHAMRILGSYQSGETLKLEIMRDRKQQTLSIEVPDNRSSFESHFGPFAPEAGAAPVVIDGAGNVVRERT